MIKCYRMLTLILNDLETLRSFFCDYKCIVDSNISDYLIISPKTILF